MNIASLDRGGEVDGLRRPVILQGVVARILVIHIYAEILHAGVLLPIIHVSVGYTFTIYNCEALDQILVSVGNGELDPSVFIFTPCIPRGTVVSVDYTAGIYGRIAVFKVGTGSYVEPSSIRGMEGVVSWYTRLSPRAAV